MGKNHNNLALPVKKDRKKKKKKRQLLRVQFDDKVAFVSEIVMKLREVSRVPSFRLCT